ncbi:MAG: hypothetical protein E4H29_05555, partial [Deltaproteobacteria bacterium]
MTVVLDDRGAQVLRLVVEDYIETAEPVGSRTISKRMSQALSPATIRNIMADLEEIGYLCQPHTSAGRIPTGAGFRYYVNYLLTRQQLARSDRDLLHQVGETEVAGADDVVRNASLLLSILSRHACVVVVSRFSHQAIRSISLLRAASDKILLVAVLQGGWVQHRLIEDEPGLTTDELEKINAYLND